MRDNLSSNVIGTARTAASCLNAGALELTECSSYVDNFVAGAAEASDVMSDIFDGVALGVAALIVTADIYHIIQVWRRERKSKTNTKEAIIAFLHPAANTINFSVLLQDILILSTALVGFAAPVALPFMLIAYQSFNIINLAFEQKKHFVKKNKLEKEILYLDNEVTSGLDKIFLKQQIIQLEGKKAELKQLKTITYLKTARIASGIAIVMGALLTLFPATTAFGVTILGAGIAGLVTTAITKKAITHYRNLEPTKPEESAKFEIFVNLHKKVSVFLHKIVPFGWFKSKFQQPQSAEFQELPNSTVSKPLDPESY